MGQCGNHGGQNDNKLRMIKENLSESIQYYSVSDGESMRILNLCYLS